QAEDGIRDFHVTGVQTCALPICVVLQEQLDQSKLRQARIEQSESSDAVDEARRIAFGLEQVQDRLRSLYTLANQRLSLLSQQSRSEERRVGKGCGYVGRPDAYQR